MPLSIKAIGALKPGASPYKASDGEGLHLLVTPRGAKLWRLAYRFDGKQKLLSLGRYPVTSLQAARRATYAAKELLAVGKDPSAERQVKNRRVQIAASSTFKAVADEWFDVQSPNWVKAYADRQRSRLDRDLVAALGEMPLAEIKPLTILAALRVVEDRDALETARRALQMASCVFRYGVATGRCERDPTPDLRGALRPPKPAKHRSSIAVKDLPEFLERLGAYDGDKVTQLAVQLILHTFVRTAELRFAEWAEFEGLDGKEPLWRIPAERMKKRKPHLVPLSTQVVDLLSDLKDAAAVTSPQLFPAFTKSGVMSENTMLYALYRMGYHSRATIHGLRSTASTILNEHQFNRDVIEIQLAHVRDDVRSTYNAAEWLPARREMMQWYADYLTKVTPRSSTLKTKRTS